MIFLHKPYIKKGKDKSKLVFDITIDKEEKQVWFEVDNEYSKYLCDDRVDAILVGLLSYALRGGHSFSSDSYITDDILFQITEYLIPSLVKYGKNLKDISIDIKTKPAVKNAGGVGTGCSCGIDSMHAILTKSNLKNNKFNVSHLCINNVGAFNECYEEAGIDKVRNERIKKSKEFAKEVNLPLIVTDSNFLQEIYQNHSLTHTYSSTFAILCLQKLWKIYYYGSPGLDFSEFTLKENDLKDPSSYELLSLNCFSTANLKIYSEGGAENRLEKTKDVYKNKLTQKYLHVCTVKENNCSVCPKCMRTILSLYALMDDLKPYCEVFDINYFYEHKDEYFQWLYNEHLFSVKINEPIYYQLLNKKDFQEFVESKEKERVNELNPADFYQQKYEEIIYSRTYKIGSAILYFPKKIVCIIRKFKSR